MLWHEIWRGGLVRIACDNSSVVDALNKHSIKGPAIVPLQRIFLIAAVYDIQISPFWLPSEENMVADAASHYDYKKLANLGLQVSQDLPRPALLRQKLYSFFTTPSLLVQDGATRKSSKHTSPSAGDIATSPTHPLSKWYRTGLLISSPPSNLVLQNPISAHSNPSTFEPEDQPLHSRMSVLTSSLEEGNESMAKELRLSDIPLHQTSSSEWSKKSPMTKRESTSRRPSALVLPPFYDLENLHGIYGPTNPIVSTSLVNTSSFNQMVH